MTELDRAWAESQIEAMADDSLAPDAKQRMRVLMNVDPEIRARVERARALRRELRLLSEQPVPRGLFWRLWQIPAANRPPRTFWLPAAAVASIATAALGISLFFSVQGPSPEEMAREAAVQDFAIALAYLQRSAELARSEVNEAVADGMRGAVSVSRQAIERADAPMDEGVDNAD